MQILPHQVPLEYENLLERCGWGRKGTVEERHEEGIKDGMGIDGFLVILMVSIHPLHAILT